LLWQGRAGNGLFVAVDIRGNVLTTTTGVPVSISARTCRLNSLSGPNHLERIVVGGWQVGKVLELFLTVPGEKDL
jgi:hypothetical protein